MMTLFGKQPDKRKTEEEKIEGYLNEGKTINVESKRKLDIFKTLRALDLKDRDYFDKLSDEERKGLAIFILVRWASAVQANIPGLDEWWVRATNENFNKNLLDLNTGENNHAKLQWLMATTASPGMGTTRHEWIGYKKPTGKTNNKIKKFLMQQFPSMNESEVELLLTKTTNKEIREYCKDLGYNDREIKKLF